MINLLGNRSFFVLLLMATACTGQAHSATEVGDSDEQNTNAGDGDGSGNSNQGDSATHQPGDETGGGDSATTSQQVRAFVGAEGFGANATGGRNGQVIKVTTLASSGAGSLQAALDQDIARIIVFEVSGVIEGDIMIPYGNVTIAGQTAPGGGITIHGRLECDYGNGPSNMIIRHIRVRADHSANTAVSGNQYDGVQCSTSSNFIFDHVAVSGGVDETFDIYSATNVTVQWSSITRSDPAGGHDEGEHNYGLINGPSGNSVSIHHNIFAHHKNRNPAIANGPSEVINNVVYNVRHGFIHHNPSTGQFNIIGNYYKRGPSSSSLIPFYFDDESAGTGIPALSYYLLDNYIDDSGELEGSIDNPWQTPFAHSSFEYIDYGWDSSGARVITKHDFSSVPVTVHSSEIGYDLVLAGAGAFPRDAMELENIQEIRDGTGLWGARIPIDLSAGLTTIAAQADSDNDGMPDAWESQNGLSTSTPDDTMVMASGYTAIEEYLNDLAQQLLE